MRRLLERGQKVGGVLWATRGYLVIVPMTIPLLFLLLTQKHQAPENPFASAPRIDYALLASGPKPLPPHPVVLPVDSGDTLESILLAGGLSSRDAFAVARAFAGEVDPRRLRPGQLLRFYRGSEETIDRVDLKITGWGRLTATRSPEGFEVRSMEFPQKTESVTASGSIETSLYDSICASGESPLLVQPLVDVFQWDVDFFRLQKGDSFTVVADRQYSGRDFVGYGPILAARFVHQGEVYEAFRFDHPDGTSGYYDRAGAPLKKQFLKAPLKFTRITSGYTHRRFHPVLGVFRPHLAIDYGAPVGTPVMSTADGVVTFAGHGRGEGNYIRIRHSSRMETCYMHLSRFARGLKRGRKVEQGEIIGYVGQTGLATGPHLDYRVRKDGEYINPLTLKSVAPDPLRGRELEQFRTQVSAALPRLNGSPQQVAAVEQGNPPVGP